MKFWTLKRHNSFQNENNLKVTHSFASRFLIFKLQQDVLKFNDICIGEGGVGAPLKLTC